MTDAEEDVKAGEDEVAANEAAELLCREHGAKVADIHAISLSCYRSHPHQTHPGGQQGVLVHEDLGVHASLQHQHTSTG